MNTQPTTTAASVMEVAARQRNVAGQRNMSQFRVYVDPIWDTLTGWFALAKHHESAAREIADLALAVMSELAGAMKDGDVQTLLTNPHAFYQPGATAHTIAEQRRIEGTGELARFYAERDKRAAAQDAIVARQNAQRQAEFDAGAPASLLARLRAGGAQLGLEGGKIVLAVGTPISAEDHMEVRTHKLALVALLRAEAEAARPMVLA